MCVRHAQGPGPVYLGKGAGLTEINQAISDNDVQKLERFLQEVCEALMCPRVLCSYQACAHARLTRAVPELGQPRIFKFLHHPVSEHTGPPTHDCSTK